MLTLSQGLVLSLASKEAGEYKELGSDTTRAPAAADHRDSPSHRASCSAGKAGGRKRNGEGTHILSHSTSFPVNPKQLLHMFKHDEALLSWRQMNICLPIRKSELILSLVCVLSFCFLLSSCLYLSP